MVDFDQRLAWLVLGCALGYIIRVLQEIRREIEEVEEIVKKNERARNEDGLVRFPLVLDIMIITLFIVTIWSAFRVEASVDRSDEAITATAAQNDRIEEVASCNLEYTAKTIRALNARTTYTTDQLEANVKVMESQLDWLQKLLIVPPLPESVRRNLAEKYVADVGTFVTVSDKQVVATSMNSYPTNEELADCLGTAVTPAKELENDEREHGTDSNE